ncbi:hypothetical protein [Pyxidicoccus parkwayensis]|uniref:hypothetical protein n=1 Tax=Pyxidicoccus parkwayensis TaxID=2813578 RepID=UPI001F509B66|nr:hypothetical protein [Pyxidicoccus parkwaysis]
MRRFPLRTLLLMLVALAAFARLYWVTHREAPPGETARRDAAGKATPATPPAPGPPVISPECRALERTLEGALRAPQDARAQEEARKKLDACPATPERACELGPALAVRSPLAAGEEAPLRGLLASLCERCPPATNPCVQGVAQSLLEGAVGPVPTAAVRAELRWSLEHAGKEGTVAACDSVVRLGLAPCAQSGVPVSNAVRALVSELSPACAKAGLLPDAVLRAAASQQGLQEAPKLVALVSASTVETKVIEPDQVTGAEPGRQAFDGDVNTGVVVSNAAPSKTWARDGALRASYTPGLKPLASMRIRANGPGSLRAIVRSPKGVGLKEPESDYSFVNPTVCHFRGTGQWEVCKPTVPLLDVDAVSVFPERAGVEVEELEITGAR